MIVCEEQHAMMVIMVVTDAMNMSAVSLTVVFVDDDAVAAVVVELHQDDEHD